MSTSYVSVKIKTSYMAVIWPRSVVRILQALCRYPWLGVQTESSRVRPVRHRNLNFGSPTSLEGHKIVRASQTTGLVKISSTSIPTRSLGIVSATTKPTLPQGSSMFATRLTTNLSMFLKQCLPTFVIPAKHHTRVVPRYSNRYVTVQEWWSEPVLQRRLAAAPKTCAH